MREINDAWARAVRPGAPAPLRRHGRRRHDPGADGGRRPHRARRAPGAPARTTPAGWTTSRPGGTRPTTSCRPTRPARPGSTLTIFPVGLFVVSVAAGCLAMVLQSRPLLAVAFVGVAVAALLFLLLPMLVMAQRPGRRRTR